MKHISRRDFLKRAAAVILATAGSGWLAGCQKSTPEVSFTPTIEEAAETAAIEPEPTELSTEAVEQVLPVEEVMGAGRGIFPGRVVWLHEPKATRWDGRSGYWWEEQNLDQAAVSTMLSDGLQQLTGTASDTAAWDALFRYFKANVKGLGQETNEGYKKGEKIAIKINLNASPGKFSDKTNFSFASPQLVLALLTQLVEQAGVAPEDITFYDAIRNIPDCIYEPCIAAGYEGVHFAGWEGGSGREKCERDDQVPVNWSGDVQGSPTYLPRCVTQAVYLINLASLKGHNLAGVTLTAKNHFGSFLANLDGKPTQQAPQGANVHGTVAALDFDFGPGWAWKRREMGTYNALVDLIGHPHLGGKTLLYLLDAFYVAQNQSADVTAQDRWQSAPFNGHWTSSLFLSQDPLAIDSVGVDFLKAEPAIHRQPDVLPPNNTCDNYLHEAALADQAPSGTVYLPDKSKPPLGSLGVHEHWISAEEKQYSRNLGKDEGIELVKV